MRDLNTMVWQFEFGSDMVNVFNLCWIKNSPTPLNCGAKNRATTAPQLFAQRDLGLNFSDHKCAIAGGSLP